MIAENYIVTGKVVYIFKNYPLPFHEQSIPAAEAAECAALQGHFWPMHDMIFEKQAEWSGNARALDIFAGYAEEMGLDMDAFLACMGEHQRAEFIQNDIAYSEGIGVSATPSFIVYQWGLRGAQPFEVFEQAIEQALTELGEQ
ncbi:MAG: thioredoxin domain-containing protein [Chloroflexia bacterium]|nr:thioredoxin domain-containing protein [Chloroflexia bacterium]